MKAKILAENRFSIRVRRRTYLFRQGGMFSGFYFVLKGQFYLSLHGPDEKEQLLEFASDGEAMNLRSMNGDNRNKVSATALCESQVCYFEKETFHALLNSVPRLESGIRKLLVAKIEELDNRVRMIGQFSKRKAIAELLLELFRKFGSQESRKLNIDISRKEIAGYTGTVPEVVSRILAEMAAKNLLRLEGRKIYFQDLEQLQMVI